LARAILTLSKARYFSVCILTGLSDILSMD
jgi:hypothetical protein